MPYLGYEDIFALANSYNNTVGLSAFPSLAKAISSGIALKDIIKNNVPGATGNDIYFNSLIHDGNSERQSLLDLFSRLNTIQESPYGLKAMSIDTEDDTDSYPFMDTYDEEAVGIANDLTGYTNSWDTKDILKRKNNYYK